MNHRTPTIPGPDPAIRVDEPTAGHPAAPAVGSGNPTRAIGLAALVALAWAGLAWHSPPTTYHLAPLLIVLAPGWVAPRAAARPSDHPYAIVVVSATIAIVTTLALDAAGRLDGPTVTGGRGAPTEAFLLIGAASLWSLARIGIRSRRAVAA